MNELTSINELTTDQVHKNINDFFAGRETRASKMVQQSNRTYFVGNGKAQKVEPKFPKLEVTDFEIMPVQALVADPNNPNMAMPVPDQPGVPSLYLTNASTKQLIGKPVGKQYHIYTNRYCYLLAQLGLKKSLPGNFLQSNTVEEDVDRGGAFCAIHIDVEGWKIPLETGNYKTELNLGLTIKHNVNEAMLYSFYARDAETDNKMSLGTVASSSFYHAENSSPDKITKHIDFWVTKAFPQRVEQLRKALRTPVTEQDVKSLLKTGRLLTPNQQDEIFQQIVGVEAQDMGLTSYAVMSGLASWASDSETFPVSSDNVGELMAKRQGIIARIVMRDTMLGGLQINA